MSSSPYGDCGIVAGCIDLPACGESAQQGVPGHWSTAQTAPGLPCMRRGEATYMLRARLTDRKGADQPEKPEGIDI